MSPREPGAPEVERPVPLSVPVLLDATGRYRIKRDSILPSSGALKMWGALVGGATLAILIMTTVVHATSSVVKQDEFKSRGTATSTRIDGLDTRLRAVETSEATQATALQNLAKSQDAMNKKLDKVLERRGHR